jgi:archaellum component FlaF (FlaF/FlaG flagellin family)
VLKSKVENLPKPVFRRFSTPKLVSYTFLMHFYTVNRYLNIIFWLTVSIILVVVFGKSAGSYIYAFYFVSFFIPIIIASSWLINSVLVPTYLLRKRYLTFLLYLFYTFIISIDLVFILILSACLLLASYGHDNIWNIMTNFRIMPLITYLIVLISAFISMVRQYLRLQSITGSVSEGQEKYITVRSERKNRRIECESILYIESMSDYVRIFLEGEDRVITRTNISHLDTMLGDKYLRIHRSYIVNTGKIESFSREQVKISGKYLPVSRTYKERVMKALSR